MPVEKLKTLDDLQRFVEERFAELSITDINGLGDILGALEASRYPSTEAKEPTGVTIDIPGCKFKAPSDMACIAIGVLDCQGGFAIGELAVNGVIAGGGQQAIGNLTTRGTVTQNWPLVLKANDVVTLQLHGAGGTVWNQHTGLTILRLR